MKTKPKTVNSVETIRKQVLAFLCGMSVLSIISFINDGFIWQVLLPAVGIAATLLAIRPRWLNWIVSCLNAIHMVFRAIYMVSIFYVVITPLSLIYKPFIMTKMRIRPSYKQKSYWSHVENTENNSCNFDKQY
jgi:hypothetical protein